LPGLRNRRFGLGWIGRKGLRDGNDSLEGVFFVFDNDVFFKIPVDKLAGFQA
jgi:hypothetical protein